MPLLCNDSNPEHWAARYSPSGAELPGTGYKHREDRWQSVSALVKRNRREHRPGGGEQRSGLRKHSVC